MLKDLCDPVTPANSTYEQLCNILNRQFAPKISIYRKFEEFYTLRKNAQETVNDWFMKIKNAATQCQFGTNLISVLKDKFVTGFNDGIIKDRLCEEDIEKGLSNATCFHCGKKGHDFSVCKYKGYRCKTCSKIGHLASVCKSSVEVKNIDVKIGNSFKEFDLFNVNNIHNSSVPLEIINVKVNDITIDMELDSGATSFFFN